MVNPSSTPSNPSRWTHPTESSRRIKWVCINGGPYGPIQVDVFFWGLVLVQHVRDEDDSPPYEVQQFWSQHAEPNALLYVPGLDVTKSPICTLHNADHGNFVNILEHIIQLVNTQTDRIRDEFEERCASTQCSHDYSFPNSFYFHDNF